MENRIKTALEFLKDNQSFKIGSLRLEIHNLNTLSVTGWSHFLNFSSLSRFSSLEELAEIKKLFSEMVDSSNDLKEFINSKSIEYILCYDDGGKASITICSEMEGILKWHLQLR